MIKHARTHEPHTRARAQAVAARACEFQPRGLHALLGALARLQGLQSLQGLQHDGLQHQGPLQRTLGPAAPARGRPLLRAPARARPPRRQSTQRRGAAGHAPARTLPAALAAAALGAASDSGGSSSSRGRAAGAHADEAWEAVLDAYSVASLCLLRPRPLAQPLQGARTGGGRGG